MYVALNLDFRVTKNDKYVILIGKREVLLRKNKEKDRG